MPPTMNKTKLVSLCTAGLCFGAICLGAARLTAAAARPVPLALLLPSAGPQLPAEGALRELVVESAADFAAVRREQALSVAQRDRIAAVLAAHRDDILLQADARLRAQRALRDAIFRRADEAAVRAAADGVGRALSDGAVLRARILAAVLPELTPVQQAAWRALLERIDDRIDSFFATKL